MITLTRQQRVRCGGSLIALSALFGMAWLIWLTVLPMPPSVEFRNAATALVSQYQEHYDLSGGYNYSPPTRTKIDVRYPEEMRLDETRQIHARVQRFSVEQTYSNPSGKELERKETLEPIKVARNDVEVRLLSSGFDIQGIGNHRAGTPFPLSFTWTISPKKEGSHDVLLDLSQVLRDDDSTDSFGFTAAHIDVHVGNSKVELRDGVTLPLTVKVTGQFGVPGWFVTTLTSVPGLIGFLLTYPLFVEWLKFKRGNCSQQRPNEQRRT